MYLDEDTMLPISHDDTPTFTLVSGFCYDYASVLLDFHNTMLNNLEADDATRYALILKFDGDLRATCVEKIPQCLSPRAPMQSRWPKWLKWSSIYSPLRTKKIQ